MFIVLLIAYLAGILLFYRILKERDLDALAARNKDRIIRSKLQYTRIDRINNLVTSLTSWIGVIIILGTVFAAVFFNYDWRKPVKW